LESWGADEAMSGFRRDHLASTLFDFKNNDYFTAAFDQEIKGARFEYLKRTFEPENVIRILR
jgi:hypothetical protein